MSAPVDGSYQFVTGPEEAFAQFNSRICSYDDLFNAWLSAIVQNNQPAADNGGPNAQEIAGRIYDEVKNASNATGVFPQLILSVIMQESSGFTRVGTTTDADTHPTGGMMQAEESPAFPMDQGFFEMTHEKIAAMLLPATQHLQRSIAAQQGNIYAGLRDYNTGGVPNPNNLTDGGPANAPFPGLANYVSDVANRLHGFIN